MISLAEFKTKTGDFDFQRNNMFSVVIAVAPTSKAEMSLNGLNMPTYESGPSWLNGYIGGFGGGIGNNGIDPNLLQDIGSMVTNLIRTGTNRYLQKHDGTRKVLFGAMSSRLGKSLLGDFEVGTMLLDFLGVDGGNSTTYSPSLNAFSCKIPEARLGHEVDRNYRAPGIKITQRDLDPFSMQLRMNPDASNFTAMNDWINSIDDPVTGYRALPADVECDIQVTLHDRMGIPHTIVMINGAIPVGVGTPELTYEATGEISTFEVQFAYRYIQIGAVNDIERATFISENFSSNSNTKIKNLLDSI